MVSPTTSSIPVRPLGSQGLKAGAQGLGCMGMSFFYKSSNGTEEESLATIARAAELGVSLLDTSDVYGPHTNEQLLGKALKNDRDKYVVATKFGVQIQDGKMVVRGDPEYVRQACEGSLKRLNINTIDLYYQHRIDPTVPIEETMAALKQLVAEGKVRYVGLSEVSAADLRKAHAVHPVTAVQLEWSLWTRDVEADLVPTCRELGIGIVAYSPLGRGFLTGQIKSRADLGEGDIRLLMPRFSEENFHKNLELVDKVKQMADKRGATPGQVALAWVHARGEDVFPIPGTKRVKYLEENVAAFDMKLTTDEREQLDQLSFEGERNFVAALKISYEQYGK